jgi:hypothetical protein
MKTAVIGGSDLVAGHVSRLRRRHFCGRVKRLLLRRLLISPLKVLLSGVLAAFLPNVVAATGLRATALLAGSVPVALLALSKRFRGCRQQHATEQRAQSGTPGVSGGQGAG